jgi:hypothetical protein
LSQQRVAQMGFQESKTVDLRLDHSALVGLFHRTPGLISDKLKAVLETAWICLKGNTKGIIFAYDEAQNLGDRKDKDQYPLSLMLDVFQSIQKKNIPFMLALAGLPTLFPKLVEARTFSERMFHVVTLDRLSDQASREAIRRPISESNCHLQMERFEIEKIVEMSGGYPYFIQFLGREVYDFAIRVFDGRRGTITIPFDDIIRKLDGDFFAGRWAKATDRQRDLLTVIAHLDNADGEFTVQEVTAKSRDLLENSFSSSHANQMLSKLCDTGLVYKNRHGKYMLAVPLLWQFIIRQQDEELK